MKKVIPLVVGSSLVAVALAQPATPPASYPSDLKPTNANLAYASLSKTQTLDLFLPTGNGPFPLVVNIHGGGFRMGTKEMLDAPIARELLKNGIAVASINYRLSGEAKFPAAVQDAKAAVRYLRANALKLKLNPNRFLAFGQSAGGNLASLLGTSSGVAEFDDAKLGNAKTSSRVHGVIDWFGPVDFLQLDQHAAAQGCTPDHDLATSPESSYLGAAIQTVPELAKKANPITYLDPTDPPFLLQKGDKDCFIAFAQSQLFFEALQKAGVASVFETMKGAGHGDMGLTTPIFSSSTNVTRVVAFARSVLK